MTDPLETLLRRVIREEVAAALAAASAQPATAPKPPKKGPPSAKPPAQAPKTPPAPAAPPAPSYAPPSNVVPIQAPPEAVPRSTQKILTITSATVSGKDQQYLSVNMRGDDINRVTFKFLLNATTEPTKSDWDRCLAEFLIHIGHPVLQDTDELVGKHALVNVRPPATVASHNAIRGFLVGPNRTSEGPNFDAGA